MHSQRVDRDSVHSQSIHRDSVVETVSVSNEDMVNWLTLLQLLITTDLLKTKEKGQQAVLFLMLFKN